MRYARMGGGGGRRGGGGVQASLELATALRSQNRNYSLNDTMAVYSHDGMAMISGLWIPYPPVGLYAAGQSGAELVGRGA